MFIFKSTDHSLGAGLDIVEEDAFVCVYFFMQHLWDQMSPQG